MAGSVLGRTPTCLSCIRRLISPPTSSPIASGSPLSRLQVRAKSKHHYDEGVIVRLLEDIPRYGRKDAIFRVDRGRMRNLWYPKNKAEYMTAQRFAELGLDRQHDVGERDTLFRAYENAREVETGPEEQQVAPPTAAEEAVSASSLAPERVHALLTTLLPPTLTFARRPIPVVAEPPETPAQKRSPLLAANMRDPSAEREKSRAEKQAIFGSVSTQDVLASIKGYLSLDPEASRIPLDASAVRFVGLEEGVDRVKSLGTWELEITVPGAETAPDVQVLRRVVEVVPSQDGKVEFGWSPQ